MRRKIKKNSDIIVKFIVKCLTKNKRKKNNESCFHLAVVIRSLFHRIILQPTLIQVIESYHFTIHIRWLYLATYNQDYTN